MATSVSTPSARRRWRWLLLLAVAVFVLAPVAARQDDRDERRGEHNERRGESTERYYYDEEDRETYSFADVVNMLFNRTRSETPAPTTRKPTPTTRKPTPRPTTEEPTTSPPVAADDLAVHTETPIAPADADERAPGTVGPSTFITATSKPPSAPQAKTEDDMMPEPDDGDNESDDKPAGKCALYNEITSACDNACGNNMLCVKYRSDGECVNTDVSTCVTAANGCQYECLEGTSADFVEWYMSPVGVPAWNTLLHNNKQIEALRAITVPRNITQFSLQFLFNEFEGGVKGKVATMEFPDERIISMDSSISGLALVNLDCAKIPDAAYSPNLESLVLNNNMMKKLPFPLLQLSNLNFLNLDINELGNLDDDLSGLPLATLYASDNGITEFPAFVGTMSTLKTLGVADNKIDQVTTVARESSLTEMALDYNLLTDFEGVFPSLKLLYLRGNQLTGFPKTLTSLPNLEVLDLTENALSSQAIDQAATTLTHSFLKELMLSSNGLHKLPDLGNVFPVLQKLWVRNNSVEEVTGAYSGKLQSLVAVSNKIKKFTASFNRLEVLDLSDNKLDKLEDIDAISPVLQSLNVSSNQLETLTSTAKNGSTLTTLTSLNASHNNLKEFDLPLSGLRTLDLSGNKLSKIPEVVWTYDVLDALYLSGNPELTGLVFTRDQSAFLRRLSAFTLDASAVRGDCPDHWKSELQGVTLCIENGAENLTNTSASDEKSHAWTWVTLAVGLVAAVALLAFIFVVYKRRQDSRNRFFVDKFDPHHPHGLTTSTLKPEERTVGLTSSLHGHGGFASLMRSNPTGIWDDEDLQERRVDYDSIKLESKLAAGAFGEVWFGTYRSEGVAIKKLSDAGIRDKHALAYFVAEIKLMAQLDHPRVIKFYGVAWTCLTDLCAVIEYMPGGDLHSLLRTSLLPTQRWTFHKLQLALDTVEALTYVHTLDDVLVHRDLKSRNVLLDDEYRAKVTDFGVSRFQRESDSTMTCGIGTGRWMAPEVIMGRSDYNEKVDIYSFGVILSELDTHDTPYAFHRGAKPLPHSEMGILQAVAAGELRPSFSTTCPPEIEVIANKCLAFRPEDRPSSLEVAYWLRQLIPMFPKEEVLRPSSMFQRGTLSMHPFPVATSGGGAAANQRLFGSEILLRSSGKSNEFSL